MNRLPIVDLAGDHAADAIGAACRDTGFFYVRGHAVGDAVVARTRSLALEFFLLPEAEKLKVAATRERYRGYIPAEKFAPRAGGRPDLYQQYKIQRDDYPTDAAAADLTGTPLQGPNRWPSRPAGFAEAMLAYHDAMSSLADTLLRLFARALGVDEQTFARHFTAPLSPLSLLYYPPSGADADRFGVHPHRDDDAFTILAQDAAGLEVQHRGGDWIDAPPLPGAFVVNIGNMMEAWSGGVYKSTPHRVVARGDGARVSLPFFAIPDYDTVVAPVGAGVGVGGGAADGDSTGVGDGDGAGAGDHADTVIHVGEHIIAAYNGNWANAA